jgi:hypothetical protein
MSGNLFVPSQPLVWNEKTVFENGIQFLNQKKEELSLYNDLWGATIGDNYYSSSSKTSAEKFKATAEKSRNEIEVLDKAVTQLLEVELAKNPLSEQAKQLSKIAIASHHGLNYFGSVIKDTYYPTQLNWGFRVVGLAGRTSNKLALSTTVLTGTALIISCINNYKLPSSYSIPWKVSMTAFITLNAIHYLNRSYRLNPAIELVETWRNIFEKAIAPEKAAA